MAALRLDGILVSGGGDLEPGTYNGGPHAKIAGQDTARDELEIALVKACQQHHIPLLGICRGLQVINVALGGSLYADLADQFSRQIEHSTRQFEFYAHTVKLVPGTRLFKIMPSQELRVNSLHHQGIRDLAPGLTAAVFAPDGLTEAVEGSGSGYLLAVQWHPEALAADPAAQAIFADFIQAAARHGVDNR
jgi:putative glutamine amidotransferase